MSDFLIKRDISDGSESLSMRESLLHTYAKIAEKGWEEFQKILSLCEADPTYWEESSTQEELKSLCQLIDVRGQDTNQTEENYEIGMSLKEFVRGYENDFLKVSWDFEFFSNYLIIGKENEIPDHLYPEDIFSLFIILDRTILFQREKQRFKRYEFVRQYIKLLNKNRISQKDI